MQKWRFTPICVRDWLLPNFKLLLPKNAFNYKLVQGMQEAPENCVLIQFVLKTSTRNTTRSWKLCFTLIFVGKWLLLNFTPLLPKNALSYELSQMPDAPENCVLIQFVLKSGFCKSSKSRLPKNAFCIISAQRIRLNPKNYVLRQFVLNNGFCQILRL